MKNIFFGVVIVVAAAGSCIAQVSLGFVNTNFSSQPLDIDDTLDIVTSLYNYGTTDFNDSIHFSLSHDGSIITDPSIWPSPYSGGSAQIEHIQPGNSVPFHFKVVIKSPEFNASPTGVVIWPIKASNNSQNFAVRDSIHAQFTIELEHTGISGDEMNKKGLTCLLGNHKLHIGTNGNPVQVHSVSLFDASGQLLYSSQQSLPIDIPLYLCAGGIIVAQIQLKDGSVVTKKLFVPSK